MGALGSLASVGLNLALADQAARRQARSINTDRDQQIRAIQQDVAAERQADQARLRRLLAAQRARSGAAGVGQGESSSAVLRGLVETANEADRTRSIEAQQQIDALRRRASSARSRNLLDLASNAARTSLGLLGSARSGPSLLDL